MRDEIRDRHGLARRGHGFSLEGPGFYVWDEDPREVLLTVAELRLAPRRPGPLRRRPAGRSPAGHPPAEGEREG